MTFINIIIIIEVVAYLCDQLRSVFFRGSISEIPAGIPFTEKN